MKTKDTNKVAHHWGLRPPEKAKNFYNFPPLRDYIHYCITGKKEITEKDSLIMWTIDAYLGGKLPVDNCLSICCGFGKIERILANNGVFKKCTGIDLSEKAIEHARKQAISEGHENLDYNVIDLNTSDLGEGRYDLIYANGALHHISKLEFVINNIYKALKPGGVLICNEYIGPKHQKVPFRQREIINAVIHLIPHKYRLATEQTFVPIFFRVPLWRRLLYEAYKLFTFQAEDSITEYMANNPDEVSTWPKHKVILMNIYKNFRKIFVSKKGPKKAFNFGKVWDEDSKRIKLNDPSECVRGDEIIPIMKEIFDDVDAKDYNGSILFYALDRKFYDEYDPGNREDRMLLELLVDIDKTFIELNELSSDHAHIIARKGI